MGMGKYEGYACRIYFQRRDLFCDEEQIIDASFEFEEITFLRTCSILLTRRSGERVTDWAETLGTIFWRPINKQTNRIHLSGPSKQIEDPFD